MKPCIGLFAILHAYIAHFCGPGAVNRAKRDSPTYATNLWTKNPRVFGILLGISRDPFEDILKAIRPIENKEGVETTRPGRNARRDLEEKLLALFLY